MNKFIIPLFFMILLISCEALFTGIPASVDPSAGNEKTLVDIPYGWTIEKNSDYSKLSWDANFKIEEDGSKISFVDSDGKKIELENNGSGYTLSSIVKRVEFEKDRIELEINDLMLVFTKKQ